MSSHHDHRASLERLLGSSHLGVPGVVHITSGKPGPVLGITILTHGNEPSGLAVYEHIMEHVAGSLLKGSILLVVNNPRAALRYFDATTDGEKRSARFVDINMNRLPDKTRWRRDDARYEVQRARELLPIWRSFDVALDIHSTTKRSRPMIVSPGKSLHKDLIRGFPIRTIIANIGAVQKGHPAVAFYGTDSDMLAFGIEAGQHEAEASRARAVACVNALLRNLHMLGGRRYPAPRSFTEYVITSSVMFPDDSYEFVREFTPFHKIKKGEVLARGAGASICAPHDGVLIMAKSLKTKAVLTEEAAFVAQPARTIAYRRT